MGGQLQRLSRLVARDPVMSNLVTADQVLSFMGQFGLDANIELSSMVCLLIGYLSCFESHLAVAIGDELGMISYSGQVLDFKTNGFMSDEFTVSLGVFSAAQAGRVISSHRGGKIEQTMLTMSTLHREMKWIMYKQKKFRGAYWHKLDNAKRDTIDVSLVFSRRLNRVGHLASGIRGRLREAQSIV